MNHLLPRTTTCQRMPIEGAVFSRHPIPFFRKGNARKLEGMFPYQTSETESKSHGKIRRGLLVCSYYDRSLHAPRCKSRLELERVGELEFHIAEPPLSIRDPGPWTLRPRLDLDARIPALSLKLMQLKLRAEEKPMGLLEMWADHAVSSLLAMVQALHRFASETSNDPNTSLSTDDLSVYSEISSSFMWIFQHILSSTPSLMLSTMLLVTNFTACSMGFKDLGSMDSTQILDPNSSLMKDPIIDEKLQMALTWISQEGRSQLCRKYRYDEATVEDPELYEATELRYLRAIADEPDNTLLLSNYAQFLYLVVRDSDRAELYFKRSMLATPADAEAIGRYAVFLWQERQDVGAAEEAFLEAIDASAGNPHHVGNYANFLWHTGGQDTCCTDSLDPPDL